MSEAAERGLEVRHTPNVENVEAPESIGVPVDVRFRQGLSKSQETTMQFWTLDEIEHPSNHAMAESLVHMAEPSHVAHRPGLARTSLSVRKDRAVVAVHDRRDDGLAYFLKDGQRGVAVCVFNFILKAVRELEYVASYREGRLVASGVYFEDPTTTRTRRPHAHCHMDVALAIDNLHGGLNGTWGGTHSRSCRTTAKKAPLFCMHYSTIISTRKD